MRVKDISLPENWPVLVRQAMLHAISLAHYGIVCTWSRAADSSLANVRLKARLDKLQTENSRLKNQNRLIMSRFGRVLPKHRPHYTAFERMEILAHKSACGWNLRQTANAFMTDESTISSWIKRINDDSLLSIPVAWNKYPSYLKHVTRQLKILVPRLGKKKIAEYFARSGLYLSATSVSRYLKSETPEKPDDPATSTQQKAVRSKHPGHTWMLDLTTVPICGGFWTSWLPNALPQVWPFCWWVFVIVDHFSRKGVGFAIFKKQPTSEEITAVLDKAVQRNGRAPKYTVTDKGCQFHCKNYENWCQENDIKPRFGAVGKHGSIAVTERFIKSLKDEGTHRIDVPFNFNDMREELALYFEWYNKYRPHEYLNGGTPQEVACKQVINGFPSGASNKGTSSPRNKASPGFPSGASNKGTPSPPHEPLKLIHGGDVPEMTLDISYLAGRKHLPIIELKKAV